MASCCQSTPDAAHLKEIARKTRIQVIQMLAEAGSGHPGGSLSACDVMTVLLNRFMRHDPKNPRWEDRDRFVLSKGHCVPAWYSLLAQAGYFPEEQLMTLRKLGSPLQGHPDCNTMESMEACTGSLGQGLSIAVGMALAGKLDKKDYRVYCMIGDGETQEGQIWEAFMSAPKFKLDNLIVILDNNKGQIDGPVEEVMPLQPIVEKLRAFNWHVIDIDGHDLDKIIAAFDEALKVKDKPIFIRADTIKGKGVSFMEGGIDWHGRAPKPEEAEKAVKELSAA
ncbi:MAG: transketolase [Candidatus Omnitrophica bacterium]|nr:MAG: Transketolase 1 [Candidatus Hinthialibacteria bacterium OLB16]MCL4735134.1 transketolase [Candidatus Omnitrophota bacterium]